MRWLALINVVLFGTPAFADQAHIVLDAIRVPVESKQPTWIALVRDGERAVIHIPTDKVVVPVEPGKYRIIHIDFQGNKRLGRDTVHLARDEFEFEAIANTITYVGLIRIKRDGFKNDRKSYRVVIHRDKNILSWACDQNPSVFKQFPVRLPNEDGTFRAIRVTCET